MIVFGTDGWRGIIARDYTFENLGIVALATAKYLQKIVAPGKNPAVVIGYDTRFMSKEFAYEVAQILASQNVIVHLTDSFSSTPQVSFHTKQKGADLGLVITASHNPPIYNGYKVKGSFGGPATPDQIAELEIQVKKIEKKPQTVKFKDFDTYLDNRQIRLFNAKESYIRYIKKKINISLINESGFNIIYDPMYGAGINTIKELLPNAKEIHGDFNPSFGEIDHPEPIQECLLTLIDEIKANKYDIGIATDGDADRLGAIDEDGNFVDSHKIFMILLKYLYEHKKKRGAVAKTVSLTTMVDMYCEDKQIQLFETPVGFKYIAKLMVDEKILIGGEESGGLGTMIHIPERDGIFNSLLLLEAMAVQKKSLKKLCKELDEEFGSHRYLRRDVKVTNTQKKAIIAACEKNPTELGRFKIRKIDKKDGYKFFVDAGWLLIRPSGTEPLFRFYAEADSLSTVNELLDEGLKLK
ncbi:MAG: phosphoglucomutase/phosphomannomutase family protein [Candidatus Kapabacteria bacterium]|nr:phosphoglucomutase/phosphomannomutase family protein [Candidatus Kapabacteria bacterium]